MLNLSSLGPNEILVVRRGRWFDLSLLEPRLALPSSKLHPWIILDAG